MVVPRGIKNALRSPKIAGRSGTQTAPIVVIGMTNSRAVFEIRSVK